MNDKSGLPRYDSPPVIELVLSVQFDPIDELHVPHFGVLWSQFRPDFPRTEEHPPIPPVIETFGQFALARLGFQVEMSELSLLPRLWFLNEPGTELIQVQQDRFIHNWRKTDSGQEYPHYPYIRRRFETELKTFSSFLESEKLPRLKMNQCEVTYINHIVAGDGWQTHSEVAKVLCPWSAQCSDEFLPDPEDVNLNIRYRFYDGEKNPMGRLHIKLQPAYRNVDQKAIFVLTLTSRGRPVGDGLQGALAFLDIGREWIVRGFTSVTTKEMHRIWKRTQ